MYRFCRSGAHPGTPSTPQAFFVCCCVAMCSAPPPSAPASTGVSPREQVAPPPPPTPSHWQRPRRWRRFICGDHHRESGDQSWVRRKLAVGSVDTAASVAASKVAKVTAKVTAEATAAAKSAVNA